MKKNFLAFSIGLLMLCSCSSSDDDSNTQNESSINPPTWIHGSWLLEITPGMNIGSGFKFTSDDFCVLQLQTENCNKSLIDQSNSIGQNTIVNEEITDNSYSIELNFNNNQTIITYQFEKVSNTEIEWTNQPSAVIYTKQ